MSSVTLVITTISHINCESWRNSITIAKEKSPWIENKKLSKGCSSQFLTSLALPKALLKNQTAFCRIIERFPWLYLLI
ncbi:hypothetical protein ACPUYX_00260 [Desulfosporosinus sp. SYSU MS00001]|uniref:hypothetical protein n=1 Tax=Desulfosporosinus sp. SYSU MS00001 TaxID=3416284 RepID=UPI003CEAB299